MFEETHRLALRLVREGTVDGLRIDHPDGLADPAGYLRRLRDGGARARVGGEDPRPRRAAARLAGRGHGRLRVPQRRRRAVRRPGRRGAADRPVGRAVGRRPPVRRGRLRGQARAGARAVRARGRPAAPRGAARGRRARAHARLAARLPHLRRAVVGRGRGRRPRGDPRGRACRSRCSACCCSSERGWDAFVTRFQQTTPRDHGQGRRGHGLLPLRAAAGAERRRRRPGPLRDLGRRLPPREPRARGALPAQPARHADARHQALGRRARADRRAGRHGGGVGRARAALARGVLAAARARPGRALLHLPDAGRRLADRARAARGLPREGAARGQAQHELDRARRRVRGAREGVLPRAARPPPVPDATSSRSPPRSPRAGDRAALGQLLLKLTVPGRARHLPGRRAARPLARRPRQPPPRSTGRAGASCWPRCAGARRRPTRRASCG